MIEIRTVKKDDTENIYILLKKCDRKNGIAFDDWKRNFDWFRESRDLENDLSGLVLTEENHLVGYTGFRFLPCKFSGNIKKTLILEDTVIHPSHRGVNGVMLTQQLMKRFAANPIMGLHFSKRLSQVWARMNAKEFPGTNVTFSKPLTFWASLREFRQKKLPFAQIICKGIAFLREAADTVFGRTKYAVAESVQMRQPFLINAKNKDALNDLCRRYSATYTAGVVRDYDYLTWRYQRHPRKEEYCYCGFWQEEQMVGLGVLGLGDNRCVYLYEFIYDPNIKGLTRYMLRVCCRIGRKAGGLVLYSKMVNRSLEDDFVKAGFEKTEKDYNQALLCNQNISSDSIIFTYGDFKIV